jgi:hypothetical protein
MPILNIYPNISCGKADAASDKNVQVIVLGKHHGFCSRAARQAPYIFLDRRRSAGSSECLRNSTICPTRPSYWADWGM